MRLRFATVCCQVLVLLCVSGVPMAAAGSLSGTVKDATGGAVANARILILTPQRAVVATARSDQDGRFTVANLAEAEYLVVAQHPPFAEWQTAIQVSGASPVSVEVILGIVDDRRERERDGNSRQPHRSAEGESASQCHQRRGSHDPRKNRRRSGRRG